MLKVLLHSIITFQFLFLTILQVICTAAVAQQRPLSHADSLADPVLVSTGEEKQPRYPGGEAAWMRYLVKHVRISDSANSQYSTATMKFMVNKDSSVSDVQLLAGDIALKEMFTRIILHSGKWWPAQQGGRTINSYKTLHITYCSKDEE